MKTEIKQFSLQDLDIIKREGGEDVDFAYAKIGFLSTGLSNNCWISEETLERDSKTVLGKFITAKYDRFTNDVKSHEVDLGIVGYIPPNAEIAFKKLEDGRIMAYTECVLSKIYATNVYEMMKYDGNYRSVSVEFSCAMADDAVNGEGEIVAFKIHSVTMLGKQISPAVKGANIQIIKFSAKEAEDVFDKLKKKFNETNRKDNSMLNEKMLSEDTKEKDEDVIMSDSDSVESTEEEKMSETQTCAEDTTPNKEETEESEEKKMSSDSNKGEKPENEEADEKDKEDDDEKSDDSEKEEEDKEMSLDAFADGGALYSLLENETEENKQLCTQLFEAKDIKKVFSKLLEFKNKADKYEAEKKEFEAKECAKEFSACMMEVKADMDADTYQKLYAEGESLKTNEEVKAFSERVKAIAYNFLKEKKEEQSKDDTILRMSAPISDDNKDTDVFSRLRKEYY